MDEAVLIATGIKGLNVCGCCGRIYDPKKEGDRNYCGECVSKEVWLPQFSSYWVGPIEVKWTEDNELCSTVEYKAPEIVAEYTFEEGWSWTVVVGS